MWICNTEWSLDWKTKVIGIRRAVGYGSLFGDSSEEPPSPFYEWPSPPRGRAVGYESLFKDLEEEPPSPGSSPGPLPQGGVRSGGRLRPKFGACFIPLRRLPTPSPASWPSPPFRGRAMCYEASLGDSRGRADGSVSLFCGERTPPSPFYEWPSPPRGSAINSLRWFINGRADDSENLSVFLYNAGLP